MRFMYWAGALALLMVGLPLFVQANDTPPRATTLIVVRHADRDGSADALSPAGFARARALAHALANAGVTAIYHSDTERTRLTAEPLATALDVTPVVLPGADIDGLIQQIFAGHRGETILVVGHSNTVNRIIAGAGGPELPELPEDKFDNLFVLTVGSAPDSARLTTLQYGAPTP
jgi:broad specificity phosphatase PhoE